MKSLLLDRTTWDLVVDRKGNLAICTEPYSVLQDVSCAIRVFLGECYYDTAKGIPYKTQVLGIQQSAAIFQRLAEAVAKTVPLVKDASCIVSNVGADRRLSGVMQVVLTTGEILDVQF
ncbi:hypothetical protein [Asaia astilbis]|uniref:hypothetical protein n=1 Tax=Asaia astilbis TaxID=610244 RepID=UPI00046F6F0A|nr:hypothetical protein [Asaia astilbis]